MKTSTLVKKLVSIILILSMVLGSFTMVFATQKPTIKMSVYGDSNATGLGLADSIEPLYHHYLYKEQGIGAYIDYFKDYLSQGGKRDVVLSQMSLPGLRPNDLHLLLDPTSLDDGYFKAMYGPYMPNMLNSSASYEEMFKQLSDEYIKEVKTSDIIVLDVGANNFLSYVGFIVAGKCEPVYHILKQKIKESGIDLDAIKEQLYALISASIEQEITNNDLLEDMADAMVYAYASLFYNMQWLIANIHMMNPTAKIVYVSIANTLSGEKINMDGMVLPVGDLLDTMIGMINYQICTASNIAGLFYYADAYNANLETLKQSLVNNWGRDEFAYADRIIKTIESNSKLKFTNNSNNAYAIIRNAAASNVSNISRFPDFFGLGDNRSTDEKIMKLDRLALRLLNGDSTLTESEKETANQVLTAYIFLSVGFGEGIHLSAKGHKQKADTIKCALNKKITGQMYALTGDFGLYKTVKNLKGSVADIKDVAWKSFDFNFDPSYDIYVDTLRYDAFVNEFIAYLQLKNPALAAVVKKMKNDKDAIILLAAKYFENGSYTNYKQNDSSKMIGVYNDGRGSKTALEYLSNKIYGYANPSTIYKTTEDYLSNVKKADLVVFDYNSSINNPLDLANYLAQITKFEAQVKKANPNATVVVTGVRGAQNNLSKAGQDAANLLTYGLSMAEDNLIYVDIVDKTAKGIYEQLYKHLTTRAIDRDYSDALKSVFN